MERMKTPPSNAWSCMRTRSPRMAPPVNGDDGSTASTATSDPSTRRALMRWVVSVDFPAPGAPVMPTVYAWPPRGYVSSADLSCG